ncbi:hypothetical protein OIU77_015019 [Salix suchowensis]|uniref:Uncharacterized protein n=1 Tax=Salix suchowensis TaxID=1278906 RepID=A0ABQ8ZZ94_9ROSI|nr:hypothetical protein OIU77_015019 [Salix suchowensis]
MAVKSLLFFTLVSAAMVAAPVAEAQLGLIGGLLGLIRIQGTLFCTANGNMGANGTATPVFPSKCSRAVAMWRKCGFHINHEWIWSFFYSARSSKSYSLLLTDRLQPEGRYTTRQLRLHSPFSGWSAVILAVHRKHHSRSPPECCKHHPQPDSDSFLQIDQEITAAEGGVIIYSISVANIAMF